MFRKIVLVLSVCIIACALLLEAAESKLPAPKPVESSGPKEQAVEQIVKLLFPDKRPDTQQLLDNFSSLSEGRLTIKSENEEKAEWVLANMRTFVFNNYVNGSAAPESKAAIEKKTKAASDFGIKLSDGPPG